jgi:hemerythrin-like metal-binding protein
VEDLAAELQRRPARAVLICGSLAMEPEVVAEHAEQVARLGERLQVAVAALGMGEWPELAAPLVRLSTARDAQGWLEGLLGQPAVAAGPAGQAGPPGDPAALRWSPALALGHAAVDAQHETLFLHAGRFVEAVRRGEADAVEMLAFIGDYAQTHFRAEEHLMRESGYPALDEHRWEHEQFVRRFTLLERSLESEPTAGGLAALGQFLVEWLRAHVGGSDQRIRDHLRRAPAP